MVGGLQPGSLAGTVSTGSKLGEHTKTAAAFLEKGLSHLLECFAAHSMKLIFRHHRSWLVRDLFGVY
jgi:hypothetical protein